MQALVERFPRTIIWGTDSPYHSYITRRLQGEGVYAEFRLKGTYEQEVAALAALSSEQQAQNNANALAFLFGDWKLYRRGLKPVGLADENRLQVG